MKNKMNSLIIIAIGTLIFWLAFGTIFYHSLEDWNWVEAFYYCVTTVTTVGSGDLHLSSNASRLFTAFYILFGVGITATCLSVIGAQYLRSQQYYFHEKMLKHAEKKEEQQKKMEYKEK